MIIEWKFKWLFNKIITILNFFGAEKYGDMVKDKKEQ